MKTCVFNAYEIIIIDFLKKLLLNLESFIDFWWRLLL